jgi:hypothetical protein
VAENFTVERMAAEYAKVVRQPVVEDEIGVGKRCVESSV